MKFFNLRCIQCSYVFCKNCHQGYHEDDDCEAASEEATANEIRDNNLVRDPQMALQARWQEQSSLAIKVMKTRFWNFLTMLIIWKKILEHGFLWNSIEWYIFEGKSLVALLKLNKYP